MTSNPKKNKLNINNNNNNKLLYNDLEPQSRKTKIQIIN